MINLSKYHDNDEDMNDEFFSDFESSPHTLDFSTILHLRQASINSNSNSMRKSDSLIDIQSNSGFDEDSDTDRNQLKSSNVSVWSQEERNSDNHEDWENDLEIPKGFNAWMRKDIPDDDSLLNDDLDEEIGFLIPADKVLSLSVKSKVNSDDSMLFLPRKLDSRDESGDDIAPLLSTSLCTALSIDGMIISEMDDFDLDSLEDTSSVEKVKDTGRKILENIEDVPHMPSIVKRKPMLITLDMMNNLSEVSLIKTKPVHVPVMAKKKTASASLLKKEELALRNAFNTSTRVTPVIRSISRQLSKEEVPRIKNEPRTLSRQSSKEDFSHFSRSSRPPSRQPSVESLKKPISLSQHKPASKTSINETVFSKRTTPTPNSRAPSTPRPLLTERFVRPTLPERFSSGSSRDSKRPPTHRVAFGRTLKGIRNYLDL